MSARLPALAAAFWWVSLSVIGFLVVPMLFQYMPTPAEAGRMAARLFTAQAWVSIACALLLLLGMSRSERLGDAVKAVDRAILFVILGLLLALVGEFGIAPRIIARENLKLWHGLGSGAYLAQWACAATVLWRVLRPPPA